jgi:maltose-binding protein MalE
MSKEEEEAFKAGYAAGWEAAHENGPWPIEAKHTIEGALEIYRQNFASSVQ